jgi:uncharacterized protein YgfB (UPF0149 family)
LLGVVPVWLVDAVVPTRLETLLRQFIERLIAGEGLEVGFRFTQQQQATIYSSIFAGELADNGWIRVNAGLMKQRMAPKQAATSELAQLYGRVIDALRSDLDHARQCVLQDQATAQR